MKIFLGSILLLPIEHHDRQFFGAKNGTFQSMLLIQKGLKYPVIGYKKPIIDMS